MEMEGSVTLFSSGVEYSEVRSTTLEPNAGTTSSPLLLHCKQG